MHIPETKTAKSPWEDPLRLIPLALTRLYTYWLTATYPFAGAGANLTIHYSCKLPRAIASRLILGNGVVLCKDAWINVSNFQNIPSKPVIILEDGCFIAPRCEISAKNRVHLERDVLLSPSVLIMDHAHAYEDISLPIKEQGITDGGMIRIGEGCWIGHNAAVICNKGQLVIGRHCVVAANAYVTRSFPDYCVIAGNPARIIRQYNPDKREWVMGALSPAVKANLSADLSAVLR